MSTDQRPLRARVEEHVFKLQDSIVSALEALDPSAPAFKRDSWLRAQGGEGRSCVFAAPPDWPRHTPTVLEKAGVNVSVVHGTLGPAAVRQMRADHAGLPAELEGPGLPFFVAGLSIVIHPRNPHAPTVHFNYRYFEVVKAAPQPVTGAPSEGADEQKEPEVLAWWFGGGGDLTPSYLYDDDATHFHRTFKDTCDRHGEVLYPAFKKWCDEYFHLPHRSEARGVGGIFWDDLSDAPHTRIPGDSAQEHPAGGLEKEAAKRPRTAEEIFTFAREVGESLMPAYLPILDRRKDMPYTEHERRWQLLRRGRYVEFNLLFDRGTKFGMTAPGARVESILISLPETARWEYMSDMGTEEGSEEKRMVDVLKNPKEWV